MHRVTFKENTMTGPSSKADFNTCAYFYETTPRSVSSPPPLQEFTGPQKEQKITKTHYGRAPILRILVSVLNTIQYTHTIHKIISKSLILRREHFFEVGERFGLRTVGSPL